MKSNALAKFGLVGSLLLMVGPGCFQRQMNQMLEKLEGIEDQTAPDSRTGVLSGELDPASAARLELIGRTSAPTRYGERTDANRIRIVAFDFGGTKLGTFADFAGNQIHGNCYLLEGLKGLTPDDVQVGPWLGDPVPPLTKSQQQDALAKKFELYKGMFRQYEKRVGTTIEFGATIGPVGTEFTHYFSNNLLVLEWRRYQLRSIKDDKCYLDHVSAVEFGVAVRIVFDVRLMTTNASINATFGIAELAASLARNEARVDVSYEVVGTSLDLLPRKTIVISSLTEYMDALDKFHAAVVTIGDAWTALSKLDGKAKTVTVKIGGESQTYPRDMLFMPDELAYYVSGLGVGDAFVHMNNVETCKNLKPLKEHYDRLVGDYETKVEKEKKEVKDLEKRLETKKKKDRLSQQERSKSRGDLRDMRSSLRESESALRRAKARQGVVAFSYMQQSCDSNLDLENRRIAYGCAMEIRDGRAQSPLQQVQCSRDEVKELIAPQMEYLRSVEEQRKTAEEQRKAAASGKP